MFRYKVVFTNNLMIHVMGNSELDISLYLMGSIYSGFAIKEMLAVEWMANGNVVIADFKSKKHRKEVA